MDTKHVTSLEISKQMSEAGWVKNTKFWWRNFDFSENSGINLEGFKLYFGERSGINLEGFKLYFGKRIDLELNGKEYSQYPAPLSDEILEELPDWVQIRKLEIGYEVGYIGNIESLQDVFYGEESLIVALAKYWLYLKQQKLI